MARAINKNNKKRSATAKQSGKKQSQKMALSLQTNRVVLDLIAKRGLKSANSRSNRDFYWQEIFSTFCLWYVRCSTCSGRYWSQTNAHGSQGSATVIIRVIYVPFILRCSHVYGAREAQNCYAVAPMLSYTHEGYNNSVVGHWKQRGLIAKRARTVVV